MSRVFTVYSHSCDKIIYFYIFIFLINPPFKMLQIKIIFKHKYNYEKYLNNFQLFSS